MFNIELRLPGTNISYKMQKIDLLIDFWLI